MEVLSGRHIIDILLVALVIYNLLLLIRGTRAVQMLLGILFVSAAYYIAGLANLVTLRAMLEKFLLVLPFAIIVLFQHEIRRALARFGRNPLFALGNPQRVEATFNELVLAARTLSSRRVGALIVIERLEGLRNYIENGIALDANVSYDLLVNIFNPESPLHDGAVIVQNDRIAAAACFLPLTRKSRLAREYGTRHRAALGISEETDGLAVIVSEETGRISVASDGELISDLDPNALRNMLYRMLISEQHPQGKR